ncbi:toxin C-terminal domain-containing protein [Duffyella gerundensis]|uniref:toxin C-terminal domain-containing protein n=1 Tax=Duffyella gerundensis TaxID=1619313 RepID=UPI003D173F09
MAAQLSAGLASGSVEGGVQGAVAGKNAVENNSLSLLLQGAKISVQGCSEFAPCRNFLAEKGLSALLGIATAKTVLDNLSDSEKEYVFNVARSGKADLIEKLTPEERDAYHYMVGQDQKGLITIFPQPDRDLTIGKLENPRYLDSQDTVLTTPDQRDKNGSSHTGNNEGIPDIGGNTTVTPIPEGSNKDDLAYLALKGKKAEQAARDLGFNKRIPAPKVPFNSHGQPAFFNGKVYISQDIDGHNVTNGWKMFNRKGDRMGTYDSNLNRIKD